MPFEEKKHAGHDFRDQESNRQGKKEGPAKAQRHGSATVKSSNNGQDYQQFSA